jgi:hypothetical protein
LPASRAACVGSPCASNPARPEGAPAATSPGDAHRTEPPPGNSPDAKEVANTDAIALENQVQSVMSAVISELEGKVTDLRTKLGAAETEHNRVAARRPFIASLPDRDALLRVVRYETMLDRQIHRALAELRRIRQVPLRDTRKKRTLRFEPI